jgi:hypothetical protein
MQKSYSWSDMVPEPGKFVRTLYWIANNRYRSNNPILDIEVEWWSKGCYFSVFNSYVPAIGGGGVREPLCPVYLPGDDVPIYPFVGGQLQLHIRNVCYEGELPWAAGDLVNVPQESDIMSEVQAVTEESETVRYARHRDKTNILIKRFY